MPGKLGAAAPRQLAANQLDGESSGYFDCADSTGWQTAFQAWSPVLDGEVISIHDGRPSFEALSERMGVTDAHRALESRATTGKVLLLP